jgi:hypothetical protein
MMIWGTQMLLPQALGVRQGIAPQSNDAVNLLKGTGRNASHTRLFVIWKHDVDFLLACELGIFEEPNLSIFINASDRLAHGTSSYASKYLQDY